MSKSRFDKAFTKFIRRDEKRISPQTFFQVLSEIERERVQRTIELRAKIVEGKLQFEPAPGISVHDNEIVWGSQRIVVQVL
jgi:hypothetical protein